MSVVAGALAAFGTMALVAAILSGVASGADIDIAGISNDAWRDVGIGGAIALGVTLLVSFLLGGYTAGRMAGREGVTHGLLVFGLAVVALVVAALVTNGVTDPSVVEDELRAQGVPTDSGTWTDIGIGAGIGSLAAMLLGSLLGGWIGEHWHTRWARRAGAVLTAARRHDDRAERDERDDDLRRTEGAPLEAKEIDVNGDGRPERVAAGDGREIDLRDRPPADLHLDDEATREYQRPSVEDERASR